MFHEQHLFRKASFFIIKIKERIDEDKKPFITDICKRLNLTPSSGFKICKSLRGEGILNYHNEINGRTTGLNLTVRGRDIANNLRSIVKICTPNEKV